MIAVIGNDKGKIQKTIDKAHQQSVDEFEKRIKINPLEVKSIYLEYIDAFGRQDKDTYLVRVQEIGNGSVI